MPEVIKVPIRNGVETIMNQSDIPLLKDWRLYLLELPSGNRYVNAYRLLGKNQKEFKYLHRMILGAPKGVYVDHINGDGLDNRRENLRLCTSAENAWNVKNFKKRESGFLGVYWAKHAGRWRSEVKAHDKRHHVGYFDDPQEAAIARDRMAIALHGEFASLNFPTHNQLRDMCRTCKGTGEITVSDGHGGVDFDACPRCSWFEPYTDDYPTADDAMETPF